MTPLVTLKIVDISHMVVAARGPDPDLVLDMEHSR